MPSSLRALQALLASAALALGGCTSLLGDFSYDPNATDGGGSGGGASASDEWEKYFEIVPTKGLITTEQGAKATFSIALKQQPTENVAIALSSSNEAEGRVSPTSVSFTTVNWMAPQIVQVTGVDDDLPDMSQLYVIRTSPATSGDQNFHGVDPIDPEVLNVDDETAGFLVTPTSGLVTSESGAEATFSIVLNHPPTADVFIGIGTDRPDEGVTSTSMLVFTPFNWMAPQIVTVTGVNDDVADGPQIYHVVTAAAVSADSNYDKLDPPDVEVTNQDNDTAGITLTPAAGLMTFEADEGDMAIFGIALNSPPTHDVIIGLTSNNPTEGVATPSVVVFTPLNWMAPQVVTVTGVDDEIADGNQPYAIVTAPAESDDTAYKGLKGPDAQLINIDDDSPGLEVTPTSGLMTTEDGDGDAATFTVALRSKPGGDVLLDVSSSRPAEGTVTPTTLRFTELNWKAPQTITVKGVDDEVADGNQPYVVRIAPNPATQDPEYAGLLEVDVAVTNIDDDSAGITVNANRNIRTTEGGGSTTFTVALTSRPLADVRIPLTSSNPAEGTVSPAALVFTPNNYKAPQVVTVKGVDDNVADGNQVYRIITEPAISDDPAYAGRKASNIEIINIDDDSPGFLLQPSNQILVTTEAGGTATFTVVLTSEPTRDVDIPVSSSNTLEGTVSPANLKFTPANWNAPQTVTVRGQDDDVQDGTQQYRIQLAPAISQDPKYDKLDPPDVTVRNTDDDSAGITLLGATGLTTTEGGGMTSFRIVLNSRPATNADVRLTLSSSRPSEGTVTPTSITFTTANWNAPQTITVTGVDDDFADGNQVYRVAISAAISQDPNYAGIDPPDPSVTNIDNDSAGFTITPTSGLTTGENGSTATFTVVLNSRPTADVTLPLRSSRPSEGTVSPGSITFTTLNWNAPRTVTITGVDDRVADGDQPYTVVTDPALSSDANYKDMDPPDVSVTNVDDDSAGITVSNVSGNTTEDGGTATFTIVLNSEPKADVSIALSSSDTTEGTVSPASVTFTPLNWSAPRRITVTGVDDNTVDGHQVYTIEIAPAISDDPSYHDLDAPDVTLTNIDNDTAGFTVSSVSGNTTEDGGTATFTVVLTSRPAADVTIGLRSNNTQEGTISITSVTFTRADWNSPRTITITGVDDDIADGNQPYTIVIAAAVSDDPNYSGLDAPDVGVINVDNDSADFTVTPTTGVTSEDGDSMTFNVSLTSRPTANVVIALESSDATEGTVSPSTLTFTPNNWNAAQTVTVTGVDDDIADGSQPYLVRLLPATSGDRNYHELDPPDVTLSNLDNDSADIKVSKAAGPTGEDGTTTTFTIVLSSRPTAGVTIPLSSSDETEGRLTVTSVAFTTNNWNTPQTVTVTGVDDDVADGVQVYRIVTGPAVSADPSYHGLNADDVELQNLDDDTAGVTVSEADGPTSEAGDTATFTIVLRSRPTAAVSIPLHSSDESEGTLEVSSVNFTTANWAAPQAVTVTGVDDDVADGQQAYKIIVGMPMSADAAYAALDPDDVDMLNDDDDGAGIDVSEAAGPVSETGTSTTFEISLQSQPTAAVTVPLSVSDESEVELGVTSVTFSPGNWQTAREVTVFGVDDDVVDGPQHTKILTGPASSDDPAYDGFDPADVEIITLDDDDDDGAVDGDTVVP